MLWGKQGRLWGTGRARGMNPEPPGIAP